MNTPLVRSGEDWTFDKLYQVNDEIEKVAFNEMGIYDIYTNQVEVISAEQMLDAYSSIGMPVFYKHWSFGKRFLRDKNNYMAGNENLAYEIVINSNPCIVYIMEQNTLLMQSLVIAHAGIGHNHFFKNNYLFKDRTNAGGIEDYLMFAQKYVAKCEEKYGIPVVESVLDSCHALMTNGVFRYKRKETLSLKKELERKTARIIREEQDYNGIWDTLPVYKKEEETKVITDHAKRTKTLNLPEENILYFIEQYAPRLPQWKKEIIRIVRNIAEYFYPQGQTKIMNEGCATWTHYNIINRLYDNGVIDEGGMIEFLRSHVGVVTQLPFNHRHYFGINPYAIGFDMMNDIVRIAETPTDEDKYWFPDIAGRGDGMNLLKDVWENYRDESFISQFLSPTLIRKYRFFSLLNNQDDRHFYTVKDIHNERGYEKIRQIFSKSNDIAYESPDISVTDADLDGNRVLVLTHKMHGRQMLHNKDCIMTMKHVANLWGYDVRMRFESTDPTLILPDSFKVSPSEDLEETD